LKSIRLVIEEDRLRPPRLPPRPRPRGKPYPSRR
jgi:hypothetical protein